MWIDAGLPMTIPLKTLSSTQRFFHFSRDCSIQDNRTLVIDANLITTKINVHKPALPTVKWVLWQNLKLLEVLLKLKLFSVITKFKSILYTPNLRLNQGDVKTS